MKSACGAPSKPGTCAGAAHASSSAAEPSPLAWFEDMVDHCLEYAAEQKKRGRKIVGILCEYTPRELILAAGGIPVCLCGGDLDMIGPAEKDLPSNLCPLVKSTYGYSARKENPFLEMADLVVAETTCDGKKKMYELLARRHPMYVLELPQKPDDSDAFRHWERELRKLTAALERRFRTTVTPAKLRQATALLNRERRLRRRLAALLKQDEPPLTGRELLDMKSLIAGIPADLEQYARAPRVLSGRRAVPDYAARVRVLLTGVPVPHGAERVMDLIEQNGGLVVCQENCTGLKPILDDVRLRTRNPIRAIAEKYFHLPCSVMTPNRRRLNRLAKLAAEYRAECVVELVWQACLTYDVESRQVRELAEKKLRLPYLHIETDYSPGDSARLATRIQATLETARSRRRSPRR